MCRLERVGRVPATAYHTSEKALKSITASRCCKPHHALEAHRSFATRALPQQLSSYRKHLNKIIFSEKEKWTADRLQVAVVFTAGERHGDGSGDISSTASSRTRVMRSSYFKRGRLMLSTTRLPPSVIEPTAAAAACTSPIAIHHQVHRS